jgi:hypothetical protein
LAARAGPTVSIGTTAPGLKGVYGSFLSAKLSKRTSSAN